MPECVAKRFPPILPIPGMVQFIENRERRRLAAREPIHVRREADLLIGHHASMIIPTLFRSIIAQEGIETNAGAMRGARPLLSEMIGGADDHDARGRLSLQQIMRRPERNSGLACAGSGHGKKIRLGMIRDALEGALLPVAQSY